MGTHLRVALVLAPLVLSASSAVSCPVCKGPTGRQVRAGLFGEDFGYHLLATASPFAVFLGITAAIRFAPRGGDHAGPT